MYKLILIDYDEGVDALMALHGDRPSNGNGSVRASSIGSTTVPAIASPKEEPPVPAEQGEETGTGSKRSNPTSPRSPSSVLAKKPKPASPIHPSSSSSSSAGKKTTVIEVLNAGNVRTPESGSGSSVTPAAGAQSELPEDKGSDPAQVNGEKQSGPGGEAEATGMEVDKEDVNMGDEEQMEAKGPESGAQMEEAGQAETTPTPEATEILDPKTSSTPGETPEKVTGAVAETKSDTVVEPVEEEDVSMKEAGPKIETVNGIVNTRPDTKDVDQPVENPDRPLTPPLDTQPPATSEPIAG